MKEMIPCEIIQDLLPLYIDGLTQEKTNEYIREHLKSCEICKNKYNNMTDKIINEEKEKEIFPEIDYLKKVKKKNQKKVVFSALASFVILIAIVLSKLYVFGFPITDYHTQMSAAEQNAEIKGQIYNPSYVYSHYKIKNGNIIIYGCLSSVWNKNQDFLINYDCSYGNININGETITSSGKMITALANKLYSIRNPYIGDMPANGEISEALGICKNFGNYTNSLQTTKEPYGWTLEFTGNVTKFNEAKFNSTMQSYACVLLAMIDNCGEISWNYVCDGKLCTKTFTAKDARQMTGNDIKSYSSSAENVQNLLDLVNIK
ncbi:MAG: DUF4825 domain-containing protein [Clostridia bacterium]|jgi:hypothetical protein|nr:DUF4825 domain-containing protein [Clostridia bacterium]